ncbi:MAG: hypothetical protein ACO1N2_01870 [Candidatus Saccharimonadota bacterium]
MEDPTYLDAASYGYIGFRNLVALARKVNLPYALFFADYGKIKQLIDKQNEELFGALDSKYIIGTRGKKINILWIRRIILDLSRKQKLFNKYAEPSGSSSFVGKLKTSKRPVRDQSDYIVNELGIDIADFRRKGSKSEALRYLRDRLAEKNIHVAVEANNYMPQSIPQIVKADLSGMYIRNPRHPYIFVCNELSGSPEMGSGRKIYTLLFLVVCLFKDRSYAVSIDKNSYSVDDKKFKELEDIHGIVNEILMPVAEVASVEVAAYSDLVSIANRHKVTPKALLYRLKALGVLKNERLIENLSRECDEKFTASVKAAKEKRGGSPGAETMIAYYQGDFLRLLSTRIPEKLRRDIARKHVSYNRIPYTLEMP